MFLLFQTVSCGFPVGHPGLCFSQGDCIFLGVMAAAMGGRGPGCSVYDSFQPLGIRR